VIKTGIRFVSQGAGMSSLEMPEAFVVVAKKIEEVGKKMGSVPSWYLTCHENCARAHDFGLPTASSLGTPLSVEISGD